MTTRPSNHIIYLLATKVINFSADTFKIRLMTTGFSFNVDTHEVWADVSASELANGNGYTTGGQTLAGVTVTENDTDNRTDIAWNNIIWTANGGAIGPTPGAIVIDDTAANDPIIGFIDAGGEVTEPDGGALTFANPGFRLRNAIS